MLCSMISLPLLLALALTLQSVLSNSDCNYDERNWYHCVLDAGDSCKSCIDDGLMSLDNHYFDCIDFAARHCALEECCPQCSSYNATYTFSPYGYLDNVKGCYGRQGCRVTQCALAKNSCSSEYEALDASCKVEPKRPGAIPVATIQNDDYYDGYTFVSFWNRDPVDESEAFEPEAIAQCESDYETYVQCEVDSAENLNLPQSDFNEAKPCSTLNALWTRCIAGEECMDQCNSAFDESCVQYDVTFCGKRCCCDGCSERLRAYEECMETADLGGCPAKDDSICNAKFCLSGAVSVMGSAGMVTMSIAIAIGAAILI